MRIWGTFRPPSSSESQTLIGVSAVRAYPPSRLHSDGVEWSDTGDRYGSSCRLGGRSKRVRGKG